MKLFHLPLAALLLALPTVAVAQPDTNQAPKGQNPANRPPRGLGAFQALTPEQQRAAITTYVRPQLVAANVTDQKQQDAVIAFVTDELEARQKLGASARSLAVATSDTALTDAQVAGLLNEYVGAIQDDKTRHQKALDTLKAAINVSQFPRLEASLTLLGLLNDAPSLGGNLLGGGAGRGGNGQGGNGRGGNGRNQNGAGQNQNGLRQNRAPF